MPAAARALLLIACCALLLSSLCAGLVVAQQNSELSLRGRAGMSYFQDPLDSQVGALYGLDMSVLVLEQTNLYGSFSHNHFDLGSQYLGTLGSYRQATSDGDFWDRLSGGLLFDQYADTRFDGLYLSQFRYFAGFALSENFGAGVTYTDPLEDADSVTIALPVGGTGPVTLRNAELVEGYLSLHGGKNLLTAAIGQRLEPNHLIASLYVTHQLNSQVSLYANSSYGDSRLWAATMGVQWTFGPGTPGAVDSARHPTPVLVRAQNSGSLPEPYADPSLGHNLNYDPQRFGSLLTLTHGTIVPLGPTTIPSSTSIDVLPQGSGFIDAVDKESDEFDNDSLAEPHGGGFIGDSATQ